MNTRTKISQRRVNRRASPLLSRTLLCLFASGAVLGIGSSSIAQVRPDAGTILDSTRQPGQPLPQAPSPVLPSSPAAPAALADDAKIAVTKFQIEGAKLFSVTTLEPLVADLVGKSLNLTQLRQAAERITRHYEAAGYFLSRAVLPQQEWREGVVRIRVVEAAYGTVDIKVQQAPSFMAGSGIGLKEQKASAVLAAQGISPGQPVERGQLERGLYLLNELPGIRPATTLNPGTKPRSRYRFALISLRTRASVSASAWTALRNAAPKSDALKSARYRSLTWARFASRLEGSPNSSPARYAASGGPRVSW